MGNSESNISTDPLQISARLSKDFTFVTEKNDPRFGDICILFNSYHSFQKPDLFSGLLCRMANRDL